METANANKTPLISQERVHACLTEKCYKTKEIRELVLEIMKLECQIARTMPCLRLQGVTRRKLCS